jgi:hypothetical protein
MAAEILIDTDDIDGPAAITATEKVRIGGKTFTARCPTGEAWYNFTRTGGSADGLGLDMPEADAFFASMFNEADRAAIGAMAESGKVSFFKLDKVFMALVERWMPLVESAFGEEATEPNRAARRASGLPGGKTSRPRPAAKTAAAPRR